MRTAPAASEDTVSLARAVRSTDPPRSMTDEVGELLTDRLGEMSRRVSRAFGIETSTIHEESTDGTDNDIEVPQRVTDTTEGPVRRNGTNVAHGARPRVQQGRFDA